MLRKITCIILFIFSVGHVQAGEGMRIVSLAPSLTQNMYYLGAQDMLVGRTSFCEAAAEDDIQVVASAIKVNHEMVVLQRPDLVITTAMTAPETLELLRRFNIRVEVFPKVNSFEEICRQFLLLGELIGKQQQAGEIIDDAVKKKEELMAQIPAGAAPRIFFQIGARPLFTVVPDTFMDDYIRFAGGVNIAADMSSPTLTRESVIVRNPDVIFIVTMGLVGDEEKAIWASYPSLKASQTGRIFIIDSNKASNPTPVTFIETLENIIHLLYKS